MSGSAVVTSVVMTVIVLLMTLYIGWTWKILLLVPFIFLIFHMQDIRDRALRRQRGAPDEEA